MMAAKRAQGTEKAGVDGIRDRILAAATEVFAEHGFAAATTLEIASRARVSKRELYALVGNKEQLLAACVDVRGKRMRLPEGFPAPVDPASLRSALSQYGARLLTELMDPGVLATFRLGISELQRSPGVAASINEFGYKPATAALESLLRAARDAQLLAEGDLRSMISRYQGMLSGDLMVWVLLGVKKPPTPSEIKHRAEEVARLFVELYGNRA